MNTIVLANGEIPTHPIALEALNKSAKIICCDGAINYLEQFKITPDGIVGDLDSITEELKIKYKSIIFEDKNLEYNDLQKAIRFCISKNWNHITILGAFGKREDHAFANLSIMLDYAKKSFDQNLKFSFKMITNSGVFTPIFTTTTLNSYKKQQISIFSFNRNTKLTFHGLRYPVSERSFQYFWEGSLNESLSDKFTIEFKEGELLVFQAF